MRAFLPAAARNALGRVLSIAAIALMFFGAFWPIFDTPISRGGQSLATIAAVVTFTGAIAPLGSRFAFTFLWAAFGMSSAVGTIGIFSIGFVYLIAAVLILLAIIATPNRSDLELKFDWRYIAAFYAGYLSLFLAFVL